MAVVEFHPWFAEQYENLSKAEAFIDLFAEVTASI